LDANQISHFIFRPSQGRSKKSIDRARLCSCGSLTCRIKTISPLVFVFTRSIGSNP